MTGALTKTLSDRTWRAAVCPGKQGILARDRKRFVEAQGRFTESLDLDRLLRRAHRGGRPYDYALAIKRGSTETVEAAEVHPATAGEIDEVIAKKEWTAPLAAAAGARLLVWHWLATDAGVKFRRGGAEEKRLAKAGVEFPSRTLVA